MTKKKKARKKSKKSQKDKDSQTQSQSQTEKPAYTTSQQENTQTKATTSHIKENESDVKIQDMDTEFKSPNIDEDSTVYGGDTNKDNKEPEIPAAPGQEQETQAITPDAAAFLWDLIFNKVAEKQGDYWRLKDSERKTLSEMSAKVANKYLNEVFGKYPDVAGLAIALIIVVAPRAAQMKSEKKKQQLKESEANIKK